MQKLTPQSDWIARAQAVLPSGGFGNFDPGIMIARGEGSHVWDEDGNEYIDYLIGSGPMLLGHGSDPPQTVCHPKWGQKSPRLASKDLMASRTPRGCLTGLELFRQLGGFEPFPFSHLQPKVQGPHRHGKSQTPGLCEPNFREGRPTSVLLQGRAHEQQGQTTCGPGERPFVFLSPG